MNKDVSGAGYIHFDKYAADPFGKWQCDTWVVVAMLCGKGKGRVKETLQSFSDRPSEPRATLSKPPQASSALPFAASSEEYSF